VRKCSGTRGLVIWVVAAAVMVLDGAAAAQNIVLEQILVKVNGAIITKTELEERQVQLLRRQRDQGNLDENTTDAELDDLLSQAMPQLIVDAIDELLLVQHGRELGMEMDDERFADIVENVKTQNNIESDEQWEEVLAAEGMTVADLRRAMERQFIVSNVQRLEVTNKVAMTDTEAREYYNANPDEFRIPGQITLREILIAAPDDAPTNAAGLLLDTAAEAALEGKAKDARASVVAGEPFSAVVARVSDAPSKANSGLVGPLNDDELAPAVMELLKDLAPGDVTEPIRTAIGYQMFKLESATPVSFQPFEDVRSEIADRVFSERRQVAFNGFMEELYTDAIIEWKSDDLREVYETRLAAIRAAAAPTNF